MSDRRETCAVANLGLEEVFCSREFGRRPARRFARTAAFEPAEPSQLEQVFLSEWFGRPEAIASGRSATTGHVSAASGSPTLVVLQGGRERSAERNGTRVRVLAAVTGVAAAALVVAGLSSGTGRGPAHPTLSALGPSPNQSSSSGQAAGSPPSFVVSAPAAPAASGAAVTPAQLTSVVGPSEPVAPQGATGGGAEPAPTAPVPTPPSTPTSSGGGGSTLSPALNVRGNAVSTLGSTVTATSGVVGQALPSLAGSLGTMTSSTMHAMAQGRAPGAS